MACRSLLKKLENKGYIQLPELRRSCPNRMRDKSNLISLLPALSMARSLDEAQPISFEVVKSGSFSWKLFSTLLARYHYLGYQNADKLEVAYYNPANSTWDISTLPDTVSTVNYGHSVGFDIDSQNNSYFAYLNNNWDCANTIRC